LMILVTAIPLAQLAIQEPPEAVPGDGGPVRVMTFNLHNGFAADGRLDLEALARVIEEQKPDILALQEVSRGWVINGTVDMFGRLSHRLGMPGVYGPTAGPLWGNALLSRFPLDGHELVSLPTEDLLLRRGLIDATVDVGADAPLRVVVTHYHHPEEGGPVRVLESAALLDVWGGAPRTVVLGDFNAIPCDREIETLREAGLVEVLAAAGVSPGYTYSSDEPFQRIDYIWVTPDLLAAGAGAPADVRITGGTASDHLGIAATLGAGE
ncbi:MAG: endonuclease/exonuclease/phosphatase family protein, partial [Thermoleophilia bacterium]